MKRSGIHLSDPDAKRRRRSYDDEDDVTPPFFPTQAQGDESSENRVSPTQSPTQDRVSPTQDRVSPPNQPVKVRRSIRKSATECSCGAGASSSCQFLTPSLTLLRERSASLQLDWVHFANQKASAVVTRASLLNFVLHCTRQLASVSPYTYHLAVSTMDRAVYRIMRQGTKPTREKLERDHRILAAAALTLASRMEDVCPVQVKDIVVAARKTFTAAQVRTWENRILQVLDFEINVPTTLDFLHRILAEAKSDGATDCWRCRKTRPPRPTLFDVGMNLWNPSYSEGRKKSAVEAIAAFVADVFIAHPVSLTYSYDVIAAAVIKVVLAILLHAQSTNHIDLDDILPATVKDIMSFEDAEKTLSCILVVYFEHSNISGKTAKSNFGRVNESLKKWAPDPDSSWLQEAIKAENPREKACKLTVYLRMWATERQIQLTFSDAAQVVQRFLLDGGRMDLGEHLKRWQLTRTEAPTDSPKPVVHEVMKVQCQQPLDQSEEFPLGYFAYDVNWKHLDAFRVFDDLFRQWSQDVKAVEALEPQGVIQEALLRAPRQRSPPKRSRSLCTLVRRRKTLRDRSMPSKESAQCDEDIKTASTSCAS